MKTVFRAIAACSGLALLNSLMNMATSDTGVPVHIRGLDWLLDAPVIGDPVVQFAVFVVSFFAISRVNTIQQRDQAFDQDDDWLQ